MSKRLYETSEQGSVDQDSFLYNDKSGWGTALKLKVSTLVSYIINLVTTIQANVVDAIGGDSQGNYVLPTGANYLTETTFSDAGLTENLNNADSLLDAQITRLWNAIGGGSSITILNTKISGSNLWFLNSIPKILIPAPGANKAINVIGIMVYSNPTSALNMSTEDVLIGYESDYLIATIPYGKWNTATKLATRFVPTNESQVGINEYIKIYSTIDDRSKAGVSEVTISIAYNVIDLSTSISEIAESAPPER